MTIFMNRRNILAKSRIVLLKSRIVLLKSRINFLNQRNNFACFLVNNSKTLFAQPKILSNFAI